MNTEKQQIVNAAESDDDPIQFKIDYCLENVKGDAVSFIESLDEYYNERGELTEAQENALNKFFDRC